MRIYFLLALFLPAVGLKAFALSEPKSCAKLLQIQMKMSVVESNLANLNTTRTPEGGPYRVKRMRCRANICNIKEIQRVKVVYEPDHPDANENGYVAYPAVDVGAEARRMNKLVDDYDRIAKTCVN